VVAALTAVKAARAESFIRASIGRPILDALHSRQQLPADRGVAQVNPVRWN
jgi:hypothetical protein